METVAFFFFFCFLLCDCVVFLCVSDLFLKERVVNQTNFEEMEEEEVEISRKNRVGKGTKCNYSNNQSNFLMWLSVNRPDQLSRAWMAAVYKDVKKRRVAANAPIPVMSERKVWWTAVKERCLNYERDFPPLNYETFSVADVLVYFQQLNVLATSKGPHRSAIRALFTNFGQPLPPSWDSETSEIFSGMKRREAQDRQDGVLIRPSGKGHRRGGKKPLTAQMYAHMNTLMYEKQCMPFRSLFVICYSHVESYVTIVKRGSNLCPSH